MHAAVTSDRAAALKQDVRTRQFFALAFGAIIGVGWVVVLGEWLIQAGPIGAVLGFVAGGLLIMLVGVCYAELATALPVSGGEVVYAYEVFGVRASFVCGWLLTLVYLAVTVFESISVGWVAATLIPGIQGPVLYSVGGAPVHLGSLLLGLAGTAALTYLNVRGARSAARLQEILTYGLLAISGVFIAAGLLLGRVEHLEPYVQRSASGSVLPGILAVFVTAPFWFAGFNVIPQVMEEKAPSASLRRVGRTIVLAIGGAIGFYALVIVSASMTMPWRDLARLELPAAGAFDAAFAWPWLSKLVLLAALLGLITTWNAVFISATRVLFALGRARVIQPALGRVHGQFGSPAIAAMAVGGIAFGATFLGQRAIVPIVNVSGTCLAFAFLVSCVSVIRLRRSRPDLVRPYRVPGGVPTAVLASSSALFILVMSMYQPLAGAAGSVPIEWLVLLGWSLAGVIFWVAGRRVRSGIDSEERHRLILGALEGE